MPGYLQDQVGQFCLKISFGGNYWLLGKGRKGWTVMNKIYYDAKQVAEMLGISKSGAYEIIKKLNGELDSKGYIVVPGKISRVYFSERWYGGTKEAQ